MSWPATIAGKVSAHRLIASTTTASVALTTSPSAVTYTTVPAADSSFTAETGVIYLSQDCVFNSSFNITVSLASGSQTYYVDAETSPDGSTWTRGTNSLRELAVRSTDTSTTMSYPFAGFFPAGTYLRFVHWASSTAVTASTVTVSGSTSPAWRLTYNFIPAVLLS